MRYATCLKAQIGSVRKMCCRKDVTLLQYCFKFQSDAAYKENKGILLELVTFARAAQCSRFQILFGCLVPHTLLKFCSNSLLFQFFRN